jgi:hypothetical protein
MSKVSVKKVRNRAIFGNTGLGDGGVDFFGKRAEVNPTFVEVFNQQGLPGGGSGNNGSHHHCRFARHLAELDGFKVWEVGPRRPGYGRYC